MHRREGRGGDRNGCRGRLFFPTGRRRRRRRRRRRKKNERTPSYSDDVKRRREKPPPLGKNLFARSACLMSKRRRKDHPRFGTSSLPSFFSVFPSPPSQIFVLKPSSSSPLRPTVVVVLGPFHPKMLCLGGRDGFD